MKITGLALVVPGLMLTSMLDFSQKPLIDTETAVAYRSSPFQQVSALPRDVDTILAVLDRGELLNGVDLQGRTTLMWAAQNGHLEIVRRLIERGVDLYVQDWWGRTARSMALENGHREIVSLLIIHQSGISS